MFCIFKHCSANIHILWILKKLDNEIIKDDVLNELSETMPYQQPRRRSYDSVPQTITSLKLLKVDKELL